jgi:hypothetical protein
MTKATMILLSFGLEIQPDTNCSITLPGSVGWQRAKTQIAARTWAWATCLALFTLFFSFSLARFGVIP